MKFDFDIPSRDEPFINAVAIAELPVNVVYKYVEGLVVDKDETGYEETYTGLVMEVLPNQRFLERDYKHLKIIGQLEE